MAKEAIISVTSKMVMEPNKEGVMAFKSATLSLDLMGNIQKDNYIGHKGVIRRHACMPITTTLLLGLTSHIRASAEKGWKTEEEHIKFIIEELGKEFAKPNQEMSDHGASFLAAIDEYAKKEEISIEQEREETGDPNY